MRISRRGILNAATAAVLAGNLAGQRRGAMYGLIGKMKATPGKRDELAAILIEGTGAMPGCLSYVVAKDPADPDCIWITEVWESEADHKTSLGMPAVKEAIAKGRPLIASFDERHVTEPIGGYGLRK